MKKIELWIVHLRSNVFFQFVLKVKWRMLECPLECLLSLYVELLLVYCSFSYKGCMLLSLMLTYRWYSATEGFPLFSVIVSLKWTFHKAIHWVPLISTHTELFHDWLLWWFERKCPHIKISTGKMFIGVGVAFLEEASNCGGGLLGLLCSGYYLVWSSLLLVHCWSRCRTPKI